MTNIEELNEFGLDITEDLKEGKVIVDVYTTWCGPCRTLSPILEQLEDEGLIKVIKEDLDQNTPLKERFEIYSIPTLLLYKDGILIDHPIVIDGKMLVNKGIMIGNYGEQILREVIKLM